MIRALRPTDVLAYVAFCNRVSRRRNVDPIDGEPVGFEPVPTLFVFLGRSLALEVGRESWVQIERGHISGLVAAKRREGADVWDVDQLALLPTSDAGRTCTRLLEQLLAAAIDEGINKVFLRLEEDDPACRWAEEVGFVEYGRESLYYRSQIPNPALPVAVPGLRPRRASDHQPLFQLYCGAVPFRVRQAEAMTLHEWRWLDGWGARPVSSRLLLGENRTDYVVESEARIAGWLQVDRRRRTLTILGDGTPPIEGPLLEFGLWRLGPGRPVRCSARDYQAGLHRALDESGFGVVRRYALYARALAARIPEVKLVPVRAS
jgi:hypothetical protein